MNRNFGIHKYFNNVPTTAPEANDKSQGYSELDFLRNQKAYLEAKNNEKGVTAEQKAANLARIKEIEARIKEIETPATAVLDKAVVDGKPQHGTAAPREVLNAVVGQQKHVAEVISATITTAGQTASVRSTDTPEVAAAITQFNDDAKTAEGMLNQYSIDKDLIHENTARSVSHTVQHKEIGIQEFRQYQKLAEAGDANAQKELALMVFSDIDNKYMPKVVGLGWLGLDGGVVEKNNRIRLFGADGHKNEIGELQLYRILKNDQGRAMEFIRRHSGDAGQLTVEGVKRAQRVLIDNLNKLAEIQQLITGKVTNSSVDVPTVLAGTESSYIQSLLAKQETLQTMQDKLTPEKKSRLGELVMSLGIALTLPGGYARFENRDITPEDIEAGKNRPLQFVLGNGPVNFTGKVSGLLPQLIGQVNVNDRETKILQESHDFMAQLKKIPSPATLADFTAIDKDLANNETVQFFLKNQDKIPQENMVNVLGYNKALAMAKAEQGWEGKGVEATLGIFGIGVGATAQKIDVNYRSSDGAIRNAVTDGVEVATSDAMRVDKLEDGRFAYTMKEVPGLWTTLIAFDNVKGEYKKHENGTITFITEKVIDSRVHIEVLDNGDEKITYSFTENKNAVSTTEPVIKQSTSVDGKDVMTLRENAGQALANNIYSWNRRDPKFDRILVDISKKNYDQAYAALQANPKYADVVKLASTDGKMDVAKMDTILTYTYGAKDTKNTSNGGTIDADTYKRSRTTSAEKGATVVKHEIAAMKEIMNVDVQPNEGFFEGKSHPQVSAASKFPGQHISMSVVATPASLDAKRQAGTDRVDHFNSAIEISDHITGFENPALKTKLIDAYSARITTEIARIKEDLGIDISVDDYKALLLGTKKPSEIHSNLAFVTGQEPKFFEARAMAEHNVCNNLTYGLAFPNFVLNIPGEKKVMDPVTETRLESGSLVAAIEVTEVAVGAGIRKDEGWNESKTNEIETKPGHGNANVASDPTGTVVGKIPEWSSVASGVVTAMDKTPLDSVPTGILND